MGDATPSYGFLSLHSLGYYKESIFKKKKKNQCVGNSLAAQWLGRSAFTTGETWVQSLVRKLRSHKPCGKKEKDRKKKINA